MLYHVVLFQFLNSIPTVIFLIWFLVMVMYLVLYQILYIILIKNKKFGSLSYDKQSYIICNILEVMVLVSITYIGLTAIYSTEEIST